MKVLITGATGFIGKYITEKLILKQHDVVVTTRNVERAQKSFGYPVGYINWDTRSEIEPSLIEGVDAVIHLLGENVGEGRWSEERKKRILESRTLSTRHLISSFSKCITKPKTWINASATGIYPDSVGEEVMTENHEEGYGFLAEVCREWEKEADAASEFARVIKLRTGVVLGSDGGMLDKLLPLFKKGVGGKVASGDQWLSWVHVKDVARIIHFCLEKTQVEGVINVVAPKPVTNKKFTERLSHYLGRPALFAVPKFALSVAMGEAKELALGSHRIRPMNLDNFGFKFKYPDLDSALVDILAYGALPPSSKESFHESYRQVQWVDRPLAEVFEFYADAHNLEKITPKFLNFKILSQSTPRIQEGTEFTYKLKIHGLPIKWTTIITEWEDQYKFVDYQKSGPYKIWYHQHFFYEYKGGTLLIDYVRYKLPVGYLGETFGMPLVKSDVHKIFSYRRDVIDEFWSKK
jgi:uncharacterized protein (TIGR01777 family)